MNFSSLRPEQPAEMAIKLLMNQSDSTHHTTYGVGLGNTLNYFLFSVISKRKKNILYFMK